MVNIMPWQLLAMMERADQLILYQLHSCDSANCEVRLSLVADSYQQVVTTPVFSELRGLVKEFNRENLYLNAGKQSMSE